MLIFFKGWKTPYIGVGYRRLTQGVLQNGIRQNREVFGSFGVAGYFPIL